MTRQRAILRVTLRFAFIGLLSPLLCWPSSGYVQGIAGSLDTTFGRDGMVVTDILFGDDAASSVAVDRDGKIIAVGYSSNSSVYSDFMLVRYNADGSLDSSFGESGKVSTDFFGRQDWAKAVVIQPDGRIVAAGTAWSQGIGYCAMARYKPNGRIDSSFGVDGKVTDTSLSSVTTIALTDGGKIILGGSTGIDFALARYNADGSLDDTFGNAGRATLDFAFGNDEINALALQPDGMIVAAGSTHYNPGYSFALARFRRDGTLDLGFGDQGRVKTSIDGYAGGVAVQKDGRIVAVGRTYTGYDFAVVRYLPDGKLDSSFGAGGVVVTDFANSADYAFAVAIQGDGKIIAAGNSGYGTAGDFAIARYNADGTLDDTFGNSGRATTDFGSYETISAMAIQSDAKVVTAGVRLYGSTRNDFVLARYESGIPIPKITSVSVSGKKLIVTGENFDAAASILLNDKAQKKVTTGAPGTLIATKAGKKVRSGDRIRVQNEDGTLSQAVTFTEP